MMLNVQQQHHLHMHRHQVPYQNSQVHRGNVIVSTSPGVSPVEPKMLQQPGAQHCKRSKVYTQTTPYGTLPHQPASVARRNARERNRVKQVNNGFAELRERIPQSIAQALTGQSSSQQHAGSSRAGSKKLSKVETLRMAVEYIRSLQRLLEENDGSASTNPSSSMSSASSTCGSVLLSEPDLGVEMRLNSSADLEHQHYHHHHHLRQDASPTAFTMTTAYSEASSSPTPSFVSEASSGGSQGCGPPNTATYIHEYTEFYNTTKIGEEELLDCISLWQECKCRIQNALSASSINALSSTFFCGSRENVH